jgi:NADH:ubiquinone oxidoreductase subunit F (NADH-binding)
MSAETAYAEPRGAFSRPVGLPRLLAGVPTHGAMSFAAHQALHGTLPFEGARRHAAAGLIERVEQAGLRGRGGAGFPTATKMRAVAAARGRPIVVINAAEGEPAGRKDRTLTQVLPHLVLDGGELAARALGASEVIVGVNESARASFEGVSLAIAERGGEHRSARARLVAVPDRYVAGQEAALVSHLNGGSALPTFTPPLAYERGVARRPTLLSNAETFAHMALIARHGPRWFRELGTDAQPGSALITLSGPVARAGVYEIEYGASLGSLVEAAGGAGARVRAVLLGGYGGSWVGSEHLHDLILADGHLAPLGASLGAGVVVLLSEHACPVAETTRVARWLARASAGQCGPCVHGLDAIATCLEESAGGSGGARARQRIERLAELVDGRGACNHPSGVARMVVSAIDVFAAELDDHARHGLCEGCRRPPELPLP